MSFELARLVQVDYVAELGSPGTSTGFGASQSGSATYASLRFISAEAGLGEKMEPNMLSQQSKYTRAAHVPGVKSCTFNLETYLYGAETPLSSTIAPGLPDVGGLIHTTIGGRYAQSGSAFSSGNSGSVTVLSNAGARFQPKEIIGWKNSTGKLECRAIKSISSDALTLHHPFSANPVAGDNIYGSYTYYPQENPTGSLQFIVRGKNANDAWVLTGLHGKFGFTLSQRDPAKIKFELDGANWLSSSGASAQQASSTSPSKPPVFTNCDLFLFPTGSTPSSALKFTTVSVTPNIKWNEIRGASGVNNIVTRVLDAVQPGEGAMTVEIQSYWEDYSYINAMEQCGEYSMLLQVGSVLGQTFAIFIPRLQVIEAPRNSADAQAGQKLKLVAFHDSISSGGSQTELTQAPYVLALL